MCAHIMGGAMTADAFVEMVARLMTREECHPYRHYDLPPLNYGDAEDAIDSLIYTARRILSERQA